MSDNILAEYQARLQADINELDVSIRPQLEQLLNINIPLRFLTFIFNKNTERLVFNIRQDDLYEIISSYIRKIYPEVDKATFPFISIKSIKTIPTVNYQVNDVSMPLSDRRRIVVIGDNDTEKLPGIPHYTMSKAKELFKFPMNHPVANTAYAMAEVYPDHYVQVTEFHEYFKQTKHAAFIELCANLGAKEICIESAEINNKTLDISSDINAPLASLGLGINIRQNKETGEKSAFRFSEENKGIKEYDTPWLVVPSWRSMNTLRRNNHLKEIAAEFSCLDDMGINAKLTAQLGAVGINIGGSFQEMTKIRLSYNVIFW